MAVARCFLFLDPRYGRLLSEWERREAQGVLQGQLAEEVLGLAAVWGWRRPVEAGALAGPSALPLYYLPTWGH